MVRKEFDRGKIYEVVAVDGHPYLYEDVRVKTESVPGDLHVYEVADGDCDGCFARIQHGVLVNFMGTIIGKHPLPLEDGTYYPEYGTAEYEGDFIGEMTLEEYLAADEDSFGIDKNSKPVDGEYAVSEGKRYCLHCKITVQYDPELFNKFIDEAKQALCFEGVMLVDHDYYVQGTFTEFILVIIAKEKVRTRKIYDVLEATADEVGAWMLTDWPEAVPVENQPIYRLWRLIHGV